MTSGVPKLQMSFKCLQANESVNGTNFLCLGITNTGELESPAKAYKRDLRAGTGHKGLPSRSGKDIVANYFLFCIVLDHVTTSTAPCWPKNYIPFANCLVWSKLLIE